jgi:hypothetical protein
MAEKSNSDMNLDKLPYDIFLDIFLRLSYKDLLSLSQVNKKLNQVANDNYLWKKKLLKDLNRWKMIDSRTFPKELFEDSDCIDENQDIQYKKIYLSSCPDILTKKEILKKLITFQHVQNTLHINSTSENLPSQSSTAQNLTLSTLSSLAMPMTVFGQLKDFVYRNVFNTQVLSAQTNETLSKIVMFGPGLETSTSCLVTNILWKSEFKTIGMIPGKDGYGSGVKLKLFNHKPFNLTILYTNVSKIRTTNNHEINSNRLIISKQDNLNNQLLYELQPQVKEACSDADGFIYVIDNDHLGSISKEHFKNVGSDASASIKPIDNYHIELNTLMKEANKNLPLLILSCGVSEQKSQHSAFSCAQIVKELELNKTDREWQVRDCQIFQDKMKDITMGFEWLLNNLDQKYLMEQVELFEKLEESFNNN